MSRKRSSNFELVLRAARGLGPLLDRVAFLGGAAVELLLTDPAAPPVRATMDVDVIVEVASRMEYYRLEGELRELGFSQRAEAEEPICRWHLDDLILDVMPTDPDVLGFSNRWYGGALHAAARTEIEPGVSIRLVNSPYFLATKLEALLGRGGGDYLASRDLEDLVAVIDGRAELVAELAGAPDDLRRYVAATLADLLGTPDFQEALPAHLPPDEASQARLPIVMERLRLMAGPVE